MEKENLVYLASARMLPATEASLWKLSRADAERKVVELLGRDLNDDDRAAVAAQNARRLKSPFAVKTTAQLEAMVRDAGGRKGGLNKAGMIDFLLAAAPVVPTAATPVTEASVDEDREIEALSVEVDKLAERAAEAKAAEAKAAEAKAVEAKAAPSRAKREKTLPVTELDPDQLAVSARWREDRVLISAGPGSGKTTTVVEMAARACGEKNARVLLLVYNCAAQAVLTERLRGKGVAIIPKTKASKADAYGCLVLTFDKLGYQVTSAAGGQDECVQPAAYDPDAGLPDASLPDTGLPDAGLDYDGLNSLLCMSSAGESSYAAPAASAAPSAAPAVRQTDGDYRISLERAAKLIARNGFGHWTHIIVDEAQDITENHAAFVEALLVAQKGRTPRLTVAGDPRQELYPGADWYSKLWAAAPDSMRAVLRYNHRSAPAIVAALNDFSRRAFPTLHHDQIAARAPGPVAPGQAAPGPVAPGPVAPGGAALGGPMAPGQAAPGQAVPGPMAPGQAVRHVAMDPRQRAETNNNYGARVGAEIGRLLSEVDRYDAYAVAPVTIRWYGMDAAALAARQTLYELRPGSTVIALTAERAETVVDAYIIATARKIKGTERGRVVVFGADLNYQSVERAALAKLYFVALSRARDELVLVVDEGLGGEARRLLEPVLRHAGAALKPATLAAPARVMPRTMEVVVAEDAVAPGNLAASDGLACARCSAGACPAVRCGARPDALQPGASEHADFLATYVRALVAREFGCLPEVARVEVVGEKVPARRRMEVVHNDDPEQSTTLVAHCAPGCVAAFRAYAAAYSGSAAFIYAVLEFSGRIGRLWTASGPAGSRPWVARGAAGEPGEPGEPSESSESGESGEPGESSEPSEQAAARDLQSGATALAEWIADAVRSKVGATAASLKVFFRPSISRAVAYDRDPKDEQVGVVVATPAFVIAGVPVEIGMATLENSSRRAMAVYCAMAGAKDGLLVNAGSGVAEWVQAAASTKVGSTKVASTKVGAASAGAGPPPKVENAYEDVARAVHAVGRVGRFIASGPLRERALAPGPGMTLCCIAADTETCGDLTIEVGAVAFIPPTGAVVGTFRRTAAGVVATAGPQAVKPRAATRYVPFQEQLLEDLTGLRVVDMAAAARDQEAITADFRQWVAAISGTRTFLHWSGNEKKLFGDLGASYDVRTLFRSWLEGGGEGRVGHTRLEDAVDQVAHGWRFKAHRAFEDALATALVFCAVVMFGGVA